MSTPTRLKPWPTTSRTSAPSTKRFTSPPVLSNVSYPPWASHTSFIAEEDLNAYVAHPVHLRAVEEWMPIWEDVMAFDYIADIVPGSLTPPPGSVGKITLLKVKENLSDEAKMEIMDVVKEKSAGADQITVGLGETFSPVNAKGFSIASVAYLKVLGETETLQDLVKEKVGDYVDGTIVVEFVVPLSS
uniref:Stress-response A/B barrel domain-containing protein n=1 Tax=Brassica campestris TaxID=3711 RepID=M4ENS4_BRACM